MSIKYVKGDAVQALVNGEVDYLLHCCNCQNNFGSGIAKTIKEVFPDAYELDCSFAKKKRNFLGNVGESSSGVLNLYGQEYYGYVGEYYKDHKRQGNYGAIARCFTLIADALSYKDLTIALPYKFASDRAGCDWQIIEELIDWILAPHFEVYIYHLEDL
ncbi:MAG: hypothetical protein GOVbin2917_36 [Prokaryotic dsDNA virus sp.]|jgi:O-acetyl-ADP-ribose deacetylase (regulator of RNase III)|nr:MAG: hypothetical protein GOVbin2917_36 [Prokaryotic dsDNA virus sp.]|tara:strand:- start:81505 stop:81981 length:477 start_codon:yes stop_codon:yes gene_type:complete